MNPCYRSWSISLSLWTPLCKTARDLAQRRKQGAVSADTPEGKERENGRYAPFDQSHPKNRDSRSGGLASGTLNELSPNWRTRYICAWLIVVFVSSVPNSLLKNWARLPSANPLRISFPKPSRSQTCPIMPCRCMKSNVTCIRGKFTFQHCPSHDHRFDSWILMASKFCVLSNHDTQCIWSNIILYVSDPWRDDSNGAYKCIIILSSHVYFLLLILCLGPRHIPPVSPASNYPPIQD